MIYSRDQSWPHYNIWSLCGVPRRLRTPVSSIIRRVSIKSNVIVVSIRVEVGPRRPCWQSCKFAKLAVVLHRRCRKLNSPVSGRVWTRTLVTDKSSSHYCMLWCWTLLIRNDLVHGSCKRQVWPQYNTSAASECNVRATQVGACTGYYYSIILLYHTTILL